MDGEIGRFTFTTHSIKKDKDIVYNTSKSVFYDIGNSEWYKTSGLKEIGIIYGTTENSYRKTSELINRIRYQEGATPVRTFRENTAAEGTKISDFVEQKTTHILKINNFTSEAIPKNKVEINEPILILQEEVEKAIEECDLLPEEVAEIEKSPLVYESPKDTVNIFLDEVTTKKQKEKRCGKEERGHEKKDRKYVHNTVANIHREEKSYIINGSSIVDVLRVIVGFLLNNDLLKYRLQFFVDGQKTLQCGILKAFS